MVLRKDRRSQAVEPIHSSVDGHDQDRVKIHFAQRRIDVVRGEERGVLRIGDEGDDRSQCFFVYALVQIHRLERLIGQKARFPLGGGLNADPVFSNRQRRDRNLACQIGQRIGQRSGIDGVFVALDAVSRVKADGEAGDRVIGYDRATDAETIAGIQEPLRDVQAADVDSQRRRGDGESASRERLRFLARGGNQFIGVIPQRQRAKFEAGVVGAVQVIVCHIRSQGDRLQRRSTGIVNRTGHIADGVAGANIAIQDKGIAFIQRATGRGSVRQ